MITLKQLIQANFIDINVEEYMNQMRLSLNLIPLSEHRMNDTVPAYKIEDLIIFNNKLTIVQRIPKDKLIDDFFVVRYVTANANRNAFKYGTVLTVNNRHYLIHNQ